MKKTLLTITMLVPLIINAQEEPKRVVDFFINTGAAYQLNSGDVIEDAGYGSNTAKMADNIGWSIGGEYHRRNRSGLMTSATLDFRIVPQKLQVYYNAVDAGHANALNYSEEFTFTNTFITPGIKLGYSFHAGTKNNIDIACGLSTSFPLNGRQEDDVLLLDADNETAHPEAAVHIHSKWGNANKSLMVDNMAVLQCAWHGTVGKHNVQAGLNFSSSLGLRPSASDINLAAVNFFGPGRRSAGHVIIEDQFRALTVFVGVAL